MGWTVASVVSDWPTVVHDSLMPPERNKSGFHSIALSKFSEPEHVFAEGRPEDGIRMISEQAVKDALEAMSAEHPDTAGKYDQRFKMKADYLSSFMPEER